MVSDVLTKIDIPFLDWQSGKVRDRASVPNGLLIVTTDRISAFDVVLPNGIPDKGRILNQLSNFWKGLFENVIPCDLILWHFDYYLARSDLGVRLTDKQIKLLLGRTVFVKKAEVVPIECVVRGYITGSLWQTYQKERGDKSVPYQVAAYDYFLPGDLKESAELPQPLFTPTTKALEGHDQNLTYREMVAYLSRWLDEHPETKGITAELLARTLKSTSLTLYLLARDYALKKGIIIADTKFEFGFIDGELCLIDEVLTPDSSRFWPLEGFKPGKPQPSFDKQFVRDWLLAIGWNKEPPAPVLPEEVVEGTRQRYIEAFERLTGQTWPPKFG